jgi:hypothetical protein
MLISVAFTLAHTIREAEYRTPSQFQSDLQSVRGTPSVKYWIPIWASTQPKEMKAEVDAGDRQVVIDNWGAEHRRLEVLPGNASEMRLRTFYYPLWVASNAGEALPTRPDSDGALLISLPDHHTPATISLDFREPLRARVAIAVSVLGWLFIGLMAFAHVARRNNLTRLKVLSES